MDLLAYGIRQEDILHEEIDIGNRSIEEWSELEKIARLHQLDCYFFLFYKDLWTDSFTKSIIYKNWHAESRIKQIRHNVMKKEGFKAIQYLADKGIELYILKGPVFEACYKMKNFRYMGDLDILVNKQDFNQIRSYLSEVGYFEDKRLTTNWDITFISDFGYPIEVHHRLFDIGTFIHTDLFLEEAKESSIAFRYEGLNVKQFDYTYNLAYFLGHFIKHIYGPGIGLRQAMDLTVYMNYYRDNIDYNQLDVLMEKLGFSNAGYVVINMCERYFGAIPSKIHSSKEVDDIYTDALFKLLLRSGTYGKRDEYMVERAIYKQFSQSQNNRIKWFFGSLFPKYSFMVPNYKYLKKLPILLPFAWIQRIIKYGFIKNKAAKSMVLTNHFQAQLEERKWLIEEMKKA